MNISHATGKTVTKILAKESVLKGAKKTVGKTIAKVATGIASVFGVSMGAQKVAEYKENNENEALFAKKQEIWDEQDINLLDRTWFSVKSIFKDQGIVSKIRKKYLKDYQYTDNQDILQNAGREYFKALLGDVDNLSEKEKIKRYKRVAREFYMQLTHMGVDQEDAEKILAGVIGELRACDRTNAAKNYIALGVGDASINRRASYAQHCAMYNLTNLDAFGKAPSEEDSMEYQHLTFSNMDEIGIQLSLEEIRKTAQRYKELKKKEAEGTLDEDGKKELAKFEAEEGGILKNYITMGYAGGYTGIATNRFVQENEEFVDKTLREIYEDTNTFGIRDRVFGAVHKYVNNHKEEFEKLPSGRNFSYLMQKATGGAYQNYVASQSGGGSTVVPVSGSTNSIGEEQNASQGDNNQQHVVLNEVNNISNDSSTIASGDKNTVSAVTNPIRGVEHNRENPGYLYNSSSAGAGYVAGEEDYTVTQSPYYDNKSSINNNSCELSGNDIYEDMKQALEKGYFKTFVRESKIPLGDILNFVFSSDISDYSLRDEYFGEFKHISNFGDKLNIYQNLNGKVKRAILFRLNNPLLVRKLSKSDINADINTKKYSEELLAEARKEDKMPTELSDEYSHPVS